MIASRLHIHHSGKVTSYGTDLEGEVHYLQANGLLVVKVPGRAARPMFGQQSYYGTELAVCRITGVTPTDFGWIAFVESLCDIPVRPSGTPQARVESMRAVESRLKREQEERTARLHDLEVRP